MPFGVKPDSQGHEIDFNRVYVELIKPALEAAGLDVFRADEEVQAGDIRTGGERRISNFLLYGLAYAELFFTEALWPDYRAEDLYEAVASYQEMLEANPTDFRLLKPLCMARGALQAKDAALQACKLALDNLPVVSWVLLGGRCRGCRGSIPPRYAAVEAFAGRLEPQLDVRRRSGRRVPAVAFDGGRRGLHDRLAKTRVVRTAAC